MLMGVTTVVNNGELPSDALVRIDSQYAHPATYLLPEVVDDFNRMAKAYFEHFKKKFPVTETYRSFPAQVDVKRRKPKKAGTPGTSFHGWAMAMDWGSHGFHTAAYKWQLANGEKYNWINPCWARKKGSVSCKDAICSGKPCGTKEEAWHIEHIHVRRYVKNIRSKMDEPPVEEVAQGSDTYDNEGGGSS